VGEQVFHDLLQTLGRSIITDSKRLQQVVKNLLSNAFKFTEKGGVRFDVHAAAEGWNPGHPVLSQAPMVAAFTVTDTGIGIPLEKQRIIFEAFQQADASTSRRYGGTRPGLAISRELASLLGGQIQLRASPGEGSTFTLYWPLTYVGASLAQRPAASPTTSPAAIVPARTPPAERVADDRNEISEGDRVLLIVEDDPHYASIVANLARE